MDPHGRNLGFLDPDPKMILEENSLILFKAGMGCVYGRGTHLGCEARIFHCEGPTHRRTESSLSLW
jgi:hypothetical protein